MLLTESAVSAAAADDVATFVDEARLTGHRTDGAGGIKHRGHHQRQYGRDHHRIEGAQQIHAANQRALLASQARHGEEALPGHFRVEHKAENGDGDDHHQDAARHLATLQTEDGGQTQHRHDDREGGDLTQLYRQTGAFVLDHHADAVGGDQQQEQPDTDAGTVGDAGGQVVQDPLTHAGDADQGEQNTHQEDGAQRHRDAQPLPQHQAEGGKGGEGDGATDGHRQLGPQTHQQRAEGGDQAGGHKHRPLFKTGGAQHVWHHYDAVNHGQEGGQPGQQLLAHAAAARRNGKIRVQKPPFPDWAAISSLP